MIGEPELAALLDREWGLTGASVTAHHGGMNSATWWVDGDTDRWVLKSVPVAAGESLAAGLAVAARLQAVGTPAGAPVPTRAGRYVTAVGDRVFALLEYVPGEALTGGDGRLVGSTLGRVHRALATGGPQARDSFHWVDPPPTTWAYGTGRARGGGGAGACDRLDASGLTQNPAHRPGARGVPRRPDRRRRADRLERRDVRPLDVRRRRRR
jgi:hypothetical protein